MAISSETKAQDLDPRMPVAGDIVSARYRWCHDGQEEPGKKIRPCLVLKVAPDSSSVFLAPISSKVDWNLNCLEVPPEAREGAGLLVDRRAWIKLNEGNRVDLPNPTVIMPNRLPDGSFSWRRGRIDDALLAQAQQEFAYRVHDKTLKGVRIPAQTTRQIQLTTLASQAQVSDPNQFSPTPERRYLPDAPEGREDRRLAIRAAAERRAKDASAAALPARRMGREID